MTGEWLRLGGLGSGLALQPRTDGSSDIGLIGAIDLGHVVLALLLLVGMAVLALGRRYEKRDKA